MSRSASTAARLREQAEKYREQYRTQNALERAQVGAFARDIIAVQQKYIEELEAQLAESNGTLLTLRSMGVI